MTPSVPTDPGVGPPADGTADGLERPPTHRSPLVTVFAAALVPIYFGGMVLANVLQARTPGVVNEGGDVLLLVGFGGFAVVGAVLLLRRPDNPVSWITALVPALLGIALPAEAWAGYLMTLHGHPDLVAVIGAWLNGWYWYVLLTALFVFLPMLFPDGRLPSRRWRFAAAVPAVGTMAAGVLAALAETLHGQDIDYVIANPIGIAGVPPIEEHPAFGVLSLMLLFGILAGFAALVVRFRRSAGIERQQLKWFIAAAVFVPLGAPLEAVAPVVGSVTFTIALIGLPVAIGIAVLRYRLYEIDRIVSRTVTYGLVTAVLVGVYGLVAVVPATVFDLESDLLVAGATLVAAAAFGPVRRRVQALVDLRFNRSRYDASRVADRFADRLQAEVDLDDLAGDLRGVVAATVQPASVSLWLRGDG